MEKNEERDERKIDAPNDAGTLKFDDKNENNVDLPENLNENKTPNAARRRRVGPVAAGIVALAAVAGIFAAVSGIFGGATLPKAFDEIDKLPAIYPDYRGTTFPPNIAPTNFQIDESAERFVTQISSESGEKIVLSGQIVDIPAKKWRRLLDENRGKTLKFDVFAQNKGQWTKFQTIENEISPDPIDPFVAYRLIEPGYVYANRIALAERSLETFAERTFFNNRAHPESCVNCHSFQNRKTERFLFHFRATLNPVDGGTIVVDGDRAEKVAAKLEDVGASCAYPAWRPTGDLIAFSANHTRQVFHSLSTQKIEVFDFYSDLVLFDAKTNEVTQITDTNDEFETFPTWSPDGATLYYCRANVEFETAETDISGRSKEGAKKAKEFRYDVMKRAFDEKTRTFGEPETVVDAASRGRSALHPRISPDGRFLVYTEAESGTFPIWRPEADLFIVDLTTGERRPLTAANGENSDSYHTWDSSGRWLVFSSRRDDGQYTRLYFTHIDENGRETKPFLLPQRDPRENWRRFKSYNVPEMITEPIRIDLQTLIDAAAEPPKKTPQK